MYCRYCGHENKADASFCKECGKSFIMIETVTSVISTPVVENIVSTKKENIYAGFWITNLAGRRCK